MGEERIKSPPAFDANFKGPEGEYRLVYRPDGAWGGSVDIQTSDVSMHWAVDTVHEAGNELKLGGLTHGSEEIWNDVFWFEIVVADKPRSIRYWADRVIWREDLASSEPSL